MIPSLRHKQVNYCPDDLSKLLCLFSIQTSMIDLLCSHMPALCSQQRHGASPSLLSTRPRCRLTWSSPAPRAIAAPSRAPAAARIQESVASRASVAMNAYYQARGRNSWNCFFNGTGLITITDPSKKGNVHLIIQSMTLLIVGA
jgi:hypothetical protein